MVGTSRGESLGPIREQRSSKTTGRRDRMLKKWIESIGRMVLPPLADGLYICNKIKLNHVC